MKKNKKKITTKVKKKVVKYKKKKATKKKVKKRKRKKKILMEDIYSIINKVQISRKKTTFATKIADSPIIENNIKDVDLKYDKIEMKTQVVFTLYPNDIKYEEDILQLEIMDDEFPDIGQIFG